MNLAFYMSWICLVLAVPTYLLYLIPLVGRLRRVENLRANRIAVPMGDQTPERPEIVDALRHEIPYHYLRHTIRLGIRGWVQIRYKYGSPVEDAKEKLRYDLFYIKNSYLRFDMFVFLQTIKVILRAKGAK